MDILIAIIGSSIAGAIVSWFLNRKLFKAQVDQTIVKAASDIVDMYKELNNDLKERVECLEKKVRVLQNDRKIYYSRMKMMARVIVVILGMVNGSNRLQDIAEDACIGEEDMEFLMDMVEEVEDEQ